ncbi:MAG: 30S ribosomal protein S4 [Opitutales bacterium]|nr:30S ribosomal protein S4 [Opitutales bacterium]
MRYTGATTRLNRRFKAILFPPTKAYERKSYLPGIHGARLKRRMSEYAQGLCEKQKLRFMFGLSEKQFRLTFEKAKKEHGVTGEVFLRLLESRLDNIVYRMGFAKTRRAARQMVLHGHVCVNGKKVNIPSDICEPGEEISSNGKPASRQLMTRGFEASQGRNCPAWLTVQGDQLKGTVNRLPIREEMVPEIKEQLIVEFYSR